ncbi:MAG: hypothetical protein K8S62_09665 [Candidatus Sabulitectum sp.]|nr:hypothetical protein [Candidatus Sabulitectum sp.]
MKFITLVLFGFSCVTASGARQLTEVDTLPDTAIISAQNQIAVEDMPSFGNLDELREWATSSTWGGGSLETVFLDSLPVYIADRCFTSGIHTSEITVYTERGSNLNPVFHIPVQHNCFHSIQVRDSLLVIVQHNMRDEEIEFASLTAAELFGCQSGTTVIRIPSDVEEIDFIITYDREAASRDYVAEAYSSIPLTDTYAVERGVDGGLVLLDFEGMRRVEEYIIPHENISAVIQIRYDMDVYDRTDVVFTRENIVMVHTAASNAGIFTGSEVSVQPYPERGSEYTGFLRGPGEGYERQVDIFHAALLFYYGTVVNLVNN